MIFCWHLSPVSFNAPLSSHPQPHLQPVHAVLTPFCQISSRLNMAMLNVTTMLSDFDSSYPSSASSDSDVAYSSPGLRTSIAAVPDSTLRTIMIKLAESSPQFHRTIMKELAQVSGESPLTSPTTPKIRKHLRRRSKPRVHHKPLTVSTQTPIRNLQRHIGNATEPLYHSGYVYHSGQSSLKILFRSWLNDNRQYWGRSLWILVRHSRRHDT